MRKGCIYGIRELAPIWGLKMDQSVPEWRRRRKAEMAELLERRGRGRSRHLSISLSASALSSLLCHEEISA